MNFSDPLPEDLVMKVTMMIIVNVVVLAFIFIKLTSASRYVFRVGVVRASIIVSGTWIMETMLQEFPLKPYFEAFIKAQFRT